jgi:hypothetical protein
MQTHHANSPGRGVAVMASREVLRIRRRCWARIQRLPILGDHGQGHGLGLGRGPHAAGLSILVAFSGICARDQIKSAHLRATSLHRATLPFFFFQNSSHISSTRRKQSKQGFATASSSNSAPSLRIGLLLLESSHLPK